LIPSFILRELDRAVWRNQMKVSREQAAENREKIITAASKLFREHGIDGVSVVDIMKAAGLTHGGFYGHFASKEDLVAQATARAVSNKRQAWMRVIEQSKGNPFKALADTYLTSRHRDDVANGCPMAALGADLSRYKNSVRHETTTELRHFIESLSRISTGRTAAAQRKHAIGAYASLVGALLLSRAVDDPKFSNEILKSVEALFTATGNREELPA
jgi:TetR/AcrR family transcriptional repressor of nem operon